MTSSDRTAQNEAALEPSNDHSAVSSGVAAVSGGLAGAMIGQLVGGRFGAAIGAVVGGVAGVALNKEAGEDIQHQVEQTVDVVKDKVQDLQPKVNHAVEAVKDKVHDLNPGAAAAIDHTTETVKTSIQNLTGQINLPDLSVDDQYEQGLRLSRSNQLIESIAAFQGVVDREPDYAEAHYNLGVVLGKHGLREQGIEHLQRSRDLCRVQGRMKEAENIEQILHKLGDSSAS